MTTSKMIKAIFFKIAPPKTHLLGGWDPGSTLLPELFLPEKGRNPLKTILRVSHLANLHFRQNLLERVGRRSNSCTREDLLATAAPSINRWMFSLSLSCCWDA
jgi:hypothetical protein